MALSTQPYKGARDFFPEDKRQQNYLFAVMRRVAHRFGYLEYDAPIIEPLELYAAKSGEEIVNEQTYQFVDRGDRKVAIRPEMTPTVSRMVAAKRQELPLPIRWFSIPNLWRYERPQRGRLREHWQLNVDLFGVAGLNAEHELITMSSAIMQEFGATPDMYEIRINSRRLMDAIFRDYIKVGDHQAHDLSKLIDKMHKIDPPVFQRAVHEIITHKDAAQQLLDLLQITDIQQLPAVLQKNDAYQQIEALLNLLAGSGINNARYDVTLMRGFDYYTGIVFEVYDTNPENSRSLFGGGRYDGLVGLFGVEPIPTVGFGLGDVTLQDFLSTHNLIPKLAPEIDLAVLVVGDAYSAAQPAIGQLRKAGLRVSVDSTGRKPDKQIKAAAKLGLVYVLFAGKNELDSGQYELKNLQTGSSETLSLDEVINKLNSKN